MHNGRAAKSAFEFGGSHFEPVGASHVSTLGTSPSADIRASLYELDARWRFGRRGHLALSFGEAFQRDDASVFDRDLLWFSVEPLLYITDELYLVARYSQIGTGDDNAGYHFDGKTISEGNSAFGYDASRFQRIALGLGWRPNPRSLWKLEIGQDRFSLIDGSSVDVENNHRRFFGIQWTSKF